MFLDKLFPQNKREKQVLEDIKGHIALLCDAVRFFHIAMEKDEKPLFRRVLDLEREGDTIRRGILSGIYEGAFLPYLRPDLCRFVEIVDSVFDLLKDTAGHYLELKFPEPYREACSRIAFFNVRICQMLQITFEATLRGEDLREKTLAIRIYEKKIDDLKAALLKEIREEPVKNFWQGVVLSDFLSCLTHLSDVIEDASDHLQILSLSMKT